MRNNEVEFKLACETLIEGLKPDSRNVVREPGEIVRQDENARALLCIHFALTQHPSSTVVGCFVGGRKLANLYRQGTIRDIGAVLTRTAAFAG